MKKNKDYYNPNVDIATKYIQENYAPLGEKEQIDYISSADIVRELSEMATVSIEQVTFLMGNAGFNVEFIDGRPHWQVYSK